MTKAPTLIAVVLGAAIITACQSPSPATTVTLSAEPNPTISPVVAPTPSPSPPPRPLPSISPAPVFIWESRPATTDDARTWHEDCPTGLDQIIVVDLSFWNFDGEVETGELVINAAIEGETRQAFEDLFDLQFPIYSVRNIDEFGGSDNASMAADNTSSYNCRYAVGGGPTQWSNHAYGRAIDINPVENPYVDDGEAFPVEGTGYIDRMARPGMLVEGGEALQVFLDAGFGWGGAWRNVKDYQHVEISP